MAARTLVLVCLAVVANGCRCGAPLTGVQAGDLRVSPAMLELSPAYLGHRTAGTVTVVNAGGSPITAPVSIDSPFIAGAASIALSAGESRQVEVALEPANAGHFEGRLTVGQAEVRVEAEGLAIPECAAPDACSDASFDTAAGQCVGAARPEGAACETRCIASGTCIAGSCRGPFDGCDDLDACTADSCGESAGCSHQKVECPRPSDPCQVAACDPATGCGSTAAPDGTLCGPDDCTAAEVSVCVQAQCVHRPRPAQGQCVNTWVPLSIPARTSAAMAHDAAQGRMILFGGGSEGDTVRDDTWERAGNRWVLLNPAGVPPARDGHAMIYDSVRGKITLFGGMMTIGPNGLPLGDTWEWDGVTWLDRTPPASPSARWRAALAYDPGRQRAVLFGGVDWVSNRFDTWEWDGAAWVDRTPADLTASPQLSDGLAMAYDPVRQRVVLVGAESGLGPNQTWEWDGTAWLRRTPAVSPPGRAGQGAAWDTRRRRLVLFGGAIGQVPSNAVWEWDGNAWLEATPAGSLPPERRDAAVAYDPGSQKVTVFGGLAGQLQLEDTWEYDGQQWTQPLVERSPAGRNNFAIATDTGRAKVVLFGGSGPNLVPFGDTWEFDGAYWSEKTLTPSPPPRYYTASAYDSSRQRLVLFGGGIGNLVTYQDTWEYDGAGWTEGNPSTVPQGRVGHALAYDPARKVTVMFGGWGVTPTGPGVIGDTWEYDGSDWSQKTPAVSPSARGGHTLTWDPLRAKVVLFGGTANSTSSTPLNDLWEWDGSDWVEVSPPGSPAARWGHGLVFDDSQGASLLFGGAAAVGLSDETWQLRQGVWLQRTPARSPTSRWGLRLAFEPVRQKVMLFGGENRSETWFFAP